MFFFFYYFVITIILPKEIDSIITSWKPEPLVSETPANHRGLRTRKVTGHVGKYVTIDEQKCLNLATHNYLGLLEDETIREKAIESLKKYGVGSCGPRGFYGTVGKKFYLSYYLIVLILFYTKMFIWSLKNV